MSKIIWTSNAINDLDHIYEYIAHDSKTYAQALVDDILKSVERLTNFPKSGRIVPETRDKKIREIFVGNYRIIYETNLTQIFILTIIHGAKKLR